MTKQEQKDLRRKFNHWFADLRDSMKAEGAPVPARSEEWDKWVQRYQDEKALAD